MRDISELLRADDLVCCPLCEDTIEKGHEAVIVIAHGLKQIVHALCLRNIDEDEDE